MTQHAVNPCYLIFALLQVDSDFIYKFNITHYNYFQLNNILKMRFRQEGHGP